MNPRELYSVQIFEQAYEADQARSVLPRVKVIGPESLNGRVYMPEAMQQLVGMYEGAKVNLDHPDKPTQSRSVTERFGWLENVRMEGTAIYADLHYNPKHAFAETFVWWAKNKPSNLGLSHNAIGTGKERTDGVFEVHKIIEVKSVDLVADPATVKGLHESHKPKETPKVKIKFKAWLEHVQGKIAAKLSPATRTRLERCIEMADDPDTMPGEMADTEMDDPGDSEDPAEMLLRGFEAAMLAIFRDGTMDAKTKGKKIGKCIKNYHDLIDDDSPDNTDSADTEEEDDSEEEEPVADKKKDDKSEGKKAKKPTTGTALAEAERKELDDLRARDRHRANRDKALALIKAANLPEAAVTDYFVEQVANQTTEAGMKAAIEDRRRVLNIRTPVSSPPNAGQQSQKPATGEAFAESLFKGTGKAPAKK